MLCSSTAHAAPNETRKPPAPSAPFEDAFLKRWVDGHLGDTERRGIIHLHVGFTATGDGDQAIGDPDDFGPALRDAAQGLIERNGGMLLPAAADEISAVWHSQRGDADEVQRVLESALAITRDGRGQAQCLLDVRLALVSKTDPAKVRLARGSNSVHDIKSVAGLPASVVVTKAFRSVARLAGGLVVLGAARRGGTGVGDVLYALAIDADRRAAREREANIPEVGWSDPADGLTWPYMERLNRIDQLGDLKPVVIAAAIAGTAFPTTLLAGMLDIEPARLEPALTHAVRLGIIAPAMSGPRPTRGARTHYSFADESLQGIAYSLVPEAERRRLHRKAAEILERDCAGENLSPEHIAAHYHHAENPRQSKRWVGKAAWDAISRGDTGKAISHLRAALKEETGETGNARSEHHLMQLLGVQMALAQRNGCAEVFNLYQRSLEPAAAAKSGQRNNAEFRALWGLQSYHLVRGEVQAAMTIGRLVLSRFADGTKAGRRTNYYRLLAHRMHGLTVMLNGQLDEAERHYGIVLGAYDPARDAALRFAFGSDQAALALAHRAWTRALKGDGAGAREDGALARRRAETLAHGHTSAHALGVLAIAALQAGSDAEAALAAQEARAIAVEHDFPYWVAWADVILAAGQKGRQPSEQMRALEAAILAY